METIIKYNDQEIILKLCKKCNKTLPKLQFFYNGKGRCKPCMGIGLGLSSKIGRPISLNSKKQESAIELYKNGLSMVKIAKELNSNQSTIRRVLIKNKVALRPDNFKQMVTNERIFEKLDSPEKAYWLGFLATDGNICGSRIQINLSDKDRDHLNKWVNFLGADVPIKNRKRAGLGKRTEPYFLVSCSFRSKAMVNDLLNQGIEPNKSLTIKPWNGPEYLMSHYWRGCVDGDGWITQNKPKTIGLCGNFEMVKGFENWVKTQIKTKANITAKNNIYRFQIQNSNKLMKILYENSPIYLSRKYALAIQ